MVVELIQEDSSHSQEASEEAVLAAAAADSAAAPEVDLEASAVAEVSVAEVLPVDGKIFKIQNKKAVRMTRFLFLLFYGYPTATVRIL